MAPGASQRFPLGRLQRLHTARDFVVIKTQGERRICGCLILNWHRPSTGDRVRLGVIVSRRLGGAVVRNRARRLLREVFRLNQHSIATPSSIVLVARSSLVGRPLGAVERDFRRCLREASLWRDTNP